MTEHPAAEPPPAPARRPPFAALRDHYAWLRRSSMGVLLALLVFSVFVVPTLIDHFAAGRLLTDVLLTLIFVAGVAAVVEHRRSAATLVVISVVMLGFRWAEWIAPDSAQPLVRDATTLAALLALSAGVGINVFAAGRALGDRIFGAIVLYLLLGLMWAVAYAAIAATAPAAFTGQSHSSAAIVDWVYFSFVTLTTVGYGDIVPVGSVPRSLATLEALVGQLYPAIIIARLVSLPGRG